MSIGDPFSFHGSLPDVLSHSLSFVSIDNIIHSILMWKLDGGVSSKLYDSSQDGDLQGR